MVRNLRSRGFSLLEVLFSMTLFIVVIASFAMVFPSGYHLNLKSYRKNQGVVLANAIVQEIAAKPFEGGTNAGDSLTMLQNWNGECPRSNGAPQCGCTSTRNWTPLSLCSFYQNNPDVASEYNYSLVGGGSTPGINVQFVIAPSAGSQSDNGLAQVVIHLQWKETQDKSPQIITLSTLVTHDRN